MRATDKALIGIVAGAVLLAGVAFAIVLLRPEPTYQAEDTPDGVAHNYLLALQQKDYERAHGYLSPYLDGYPLTAEQFEDQVDDRGYWFRGIGESTLSIVSTEVYGTRAEIEVRKTSFRGGGLFESGQWISSFEMNLSLVGGEWKIVNSEDYFISCWTRIEGCS